MNSEQFRARMTELLAQERDNPIRFWYLSYADDDGWRGAIIVPAQGFVSANALTHALEINPGGEVKGAPIPDDMPPPPDLIGRLLNKKDLEQLGGAAKWQ